jgi:hypothetical protein
MGYRGLPVRKHSAWDPFRRPRGLDFRVCEIPDFLALKKNYLPAQNLPPRAHGVVHHDAGGPVSLKVHVVWWQMLAGGFAVNAISHLGEL